MIEQAFVLGQIGKAIYREDDRYFLLSAERDALPVECRTGDIALLVDSGAEISETSTDDLDLDGLKAALQSRTACHDALTATLGGLDRDLPNGTRILFIKAAEDLLTDPTLFDFTRNRVLSRPLPDAADAKGAARLSNKLGLTVSEGLFDEIAKAQSAVLKVAEAWAAVAGEWFQLRDDLAAAETSLIEMGIFAELASKLRGGWLGRQALRVLPNDPRLSEVVLAMSDWLERFVETARPALNQASPNYRLFLGGQLISLIGTWMQVVAQLWLVYRLTGSAVLLGFVGFSSQVPVFLFAPFAGEFVDRSNRHRVIMGTQTAAMVLAFVLAGLTLTGAVRVWHVCVLAALLGVVNALDIPARQVFIAEVVGRENMVKAIALNSSVFNGARIVGPAIAGALVSMIGEGWCFFANGVSYIAVIAGLLMMKVPSKPRIQKPSSTFAHIREGAHFVYRTRPIRALLVMLGVISVIGMPYSVLMPVFAGILHGGPRALGVLIGAAGTGALVGTITIASRGDVRGLGKWVAISAAGFGISLTAFSASRHLWLSFILLVPAGFSLMVEMASSNTLIQTMVPDRLRGRVMSFYSMMFMGGAPIGSLLVGALAGRLGAPTTVAAGGAICVIAAAIFATRLPGLRVEARRLVITQETAAGEPARAMTAGSVLPERAD